MYSYHHILHPKSQLLLHYSPEIKLKLFQIYHFIIYNTNVHVQAFKTFLLQRLHTCTQDKWQLHPSFHGTTQLRLNSLHHLVTVINLLSRRYLITSLQKPGHFPSRLSLAPSCPRRWSWPWSWSLIASGRAERWGAALGYLFTNTSEEIRLHWVVGRSFSPIAFLWSAAASGMFSHRIVFSLQIQSVWHQFYIFFRLFMKSYLILHYNVMSNKS